MKRMLSVLLLATIMLPVATVHGEMEPLRIEELKHTDMNAYYLNETADQLIEKKVPISYENPTEKYSLALHALKTAPQLDLYPLFTNIHFNTIQQVNNSLLIDLRIDLQWGSIGEYFTLQALQKTIFQFSEINSIYITRDGKRIDSLMGHVELPYPITRQID